MIDRTTEAVVNTNAEIPFSEGLHIGVLVDFIRQWHAGRELATPSELQDNRHEEMATALRRAEFWLRSQHADINEGMTAVIADMLSVDIPYPEPV